MRLFFLILALAATSAFAQKTVVKNDNNYTITSGKCVMTVDSEHGGKVISLKCDGKELLAQHQQKSEHVRFENPNDFGSTFWPSPQYEWNWPPIATYDNKPYSAKQDKSSLTLVSGEDEKYPYVFEKVFKPLGKGSFEITYNIKNIGGSEVKVGPWEITRVPSGGYIFFDAPALRPLTEISYTTEMGIQWMQYQPKERQNRKIFADAKGWLAFANDGLLFVKQFPDIASSEAAPEEEEVEIYHNMGKTYTEIENQGAYATLQPGESTSWKVKWTLQSVDANASKTELKTAVEQIMK